PASSTIVSISQLPKSKLVDNTKGLKATDKGLLQTDARGETTIPGIFASGDVVNGARTVVEAVAYSKMVVNAMDEYIRAKNGESAEPAEEQL
ncbi:MAG: FAD-dependent oxidoreductase, partial [Clostridia bacterium]|nr:FAD-dependent oxidoreductase [Clostridia bacterium]